MESFANRKPSYGINQTMVSSERPADLGESQTLRINNSKDGTLEGGGSFVNEGRDENQPQLELRDQTLRETGVSLIEENENENSSNSGSANNNSFTYSKRERASFFASALKDQLAEGDAPALDQINIGHMQDILQNRITWSDMSLVDKLKLVKIMYLVAGLGNLMFFCSLLFFQFSDSIELEIAETFAGFGCFLLWTSIIGNFQNT